MRMVIRSTGNVQVRKVYLTQFCDMKSIVALYCSSHSTRLDRWLSWWYPVYILLNLIHCFWTRTTQRVFPFNFYLCNCIYFHVQYPPCRKLWNCGKAPEFELWPALILKEESTKEEEEDGRKITAGGSIDIFTDKYSSWQVWYRHDWVVCGTCTYAHCVCGCFRLDNSMYMREDSCKYTIYPVFSCK